MRNRKKVLMLAVAVVAMLGAASAFAAGDEVRADVPFAFHAGNEQLPAGNYLFILDDPNEPNLLVIETPSGRRHEFVLTYGDDEPTAADKTELVFDRYGRDYFLSELRVTGYDEGRVLLKSPRERTEMRQARLTLSLEKKG